MIKNNNNNNSLKMVNFIFNLYQNLLDLEKIILYTKHSYTLKYEVCVCYRRFAYEFKQRITWVGTFNYLYFSWPIRNSQILSR